MIRVRSAPTIGISTVILFLSLACGGSKDGGSGGSGGNGGSSGTTTSDTTAPTVGSAISFTGVGSSALTVQWGGASDDTTAAASLQYRVVKDDTAAANIDTIAEADAKSGADLLQDYTANLTSKAVSGLSASTTYHFAVVVKDAAGNKSIYSPASQATSAPGTLTTPTFNPVAGTYASAQNITITSDAGSTICYRTDGTDPAATTPGTCNGGSTTLASGSSFSLSSSATLKAIATQASFTNSGVTTGAYVIDTTAPTTGTAISFSGVTSSGFTANWGAASDTDTAQANLQYKVVKDNTAAANINSVGLADAKTGGDLLQDWTANITTKAITGLSASTTYFVAVLVKDQAGNKALYAPASQATSAAAAWTSIVNTTVGTGTTGNATGSAAPFGLALDASGNAYVHISTKVYRYTSAGAADTAWGTSGASATVTSAGTGTGNLLGIAIDNSSRVYVPGNTSATNRVQRLSADGLTVTNIITATSDGITKRAVAVNSAGNILWLINSVPEIRRYQDVGGT